MTVDAEARLRVLTAEVCEQLGAVAAGFWLVDGNTLRQAAFVAGARLDPEVGSRFAEATRSVPLDPTAHLGIVGAAVLGLPAISRASQLPSETGSGLWLRAFGASRSIAVPLGVVRDDHGPPKCGGVLSVALPAESPLDDEAVVRVLAAAGELACEAHSHEGRATALD